MKRATFCLVCGAASPLRAKRCENCDAPLKPKLRVRRGPRLRFGRITKLALVVGLAVVASVVALATWILLGG